MAIIHGATALVKAASGPRQLRKSAWLPRFVIARGAAGATLAVVSLLPLLLGATPAIAATPKVRISGLSDVAFGTIANLGIDAVRSQNICIYSTSSTNGYNVTASGSGPSGSFQLASGAQSLPFDVEWSSSSGQSSGTQLSPNVPLTGLVSSATQQTCNSGPATTASLVVVLRSTSLSSATAGTYNGTLTLLVGPE